MSQTIIILTEDALVPTDVTQILGLAQPDTETTYRVIVPTDVERSVVADFLNNLAILDLKEAWEDLTGANQVSPEAARTEAGQALAASVDALEAAGATVDAATIADEPVEALRSELEAAGDAALVVAVTQPHAVEDTFHRNWADQAEHTLGVPVLHFYTGTSFVGS